MRKSWFDMHAYWRDPAIWQDQPPQFTDRRFHCFVRAGDLPRKAWRSLCGLWTVYDSIGGRGARRPLATLRCGACDRLEMHKRGVEESLPPTVPQKGY